MNIERTPKATTVYTLTLAANATEVILADANMYKVLTSGGNLAISRDNGSSIEPMFAGRGEKNVPFKRLTVRNLTGGSNTFTILVGDTDFIDDTVNLASTITVTPEVPNGQYVNQSAIAANTPQTIFTPAANVRGAVVLYVGVFDALAGQQALLAKASAPTTVIDGEVICLAAEASAGRLYVDSPVQRPVAAGLGLYFISNTLGSSAGYRAFRYRLL